MPVAGRVGAAAAVAKGAGWSVVLDELTRQVETGKVYDRDLPTIAASVEALLVALTRRHGLRPGRGRRR